MSRRETKNSEKRDAGAEALSRAIEALRRGDVIVFPTETFYGLGADALSAVAVERVVSLKGRNPDHPLPVIIADAEMLREIVTEVPPVAERLMNYFWPGPLTLVLAAAKNLPAPLLNRAGQIGVRISSHPIATRLSRELGRPLTATSANPAGKEPARTVEEAMAYFSDKIAIFLDGGRLAGTTGSTVVEVAGNNLRTIREGEISLLELKKALGDIR